MRNIDPKDWIFSTEHVLINLKTEQIVKKEGEGTDAEFCFYSSKDANEPYCRIISEAGASNKIEKKPMTCILDDFWKYLDRIFKNGFDYSDFCMF